MTLEATTTPSLAPRAEAGPVIHPRWVRITHWVNALAMLVMIGLVLLKMLLLPPIQLLVASPFR